MFGMVAADHDSKPMKHSPLSPPARPAPPTRALSEASTRSGSRRGRAALGVLGAVVLVACDNDPSTVVESALPTDPPETVIEPNQPVVPPVVAEGALIDVSAASQVGVVLDEIPEALRAPLAAYYLSQPAEFWTERAIRQLQHTTYRLTYRAFYYEESEAKQMLALPPRQLWDIELGEGGARRETTADGHDAVLVDYTLATTLLSDAATPGESEPALAAIGGVWSEAFSLPLDPEFVFQRTGYACIDEDGYPLGTADSENVPQVYDDFCEVETPDEPSCHLTQFPVESCVEALERAVGRVDMELLFERAPYTSEAADAVRVVNYTQSEAPDLRVIPEGLANNRITYRYIEPDSCALVEGCVTGSGWRRLLLYDASIENASPVELAVGAVDDESPFVQRNVFEFSACHEHYHYSHYGNFSYGEAPGEKRAFCVESTDRYFNSEQTPLAHPFGCDNQGIASGWGDTYIAGIECNWIDITDLEIPEGGIEQELEFALNPDGFICEGTPVVDAAGEQVFTPTDEVGENGGVVEKPSCDFVDGYASNNLAVQSVTVPDDGGFITAECTRGQAGPLRDCGFVEREENLPCTPGSTVTLDCTIPEGGPTQVLRVCENSVTLGGVTACMYVDALATAVVESAGTAVTFTCPAARSDVETGGYGYFGASLMPNEPAVGVTCAVVDG
jgi:hypothetical protein